ncbi:hypothetical protein SAPIO_CDS8275 [Scedosporium apiospermum]|uniref:SEP domain-containing protein n=1 Tax=Pseudallescheria apiosperma TaxID=563466 RepID=A0A084FZ96_PSEDA|nr:uncharacterized protein SAPIO_CDS8275 [Scedosporium apiospermum]KEZ40408.1 hypothetical protein SAPIO_CDS8275 [Scedosporium apiospermum]
MATNDEKLARLQALTGTPTETAREYLEAFDWNIEAAAQALLEDADGGDDSAGEQGSSTQVPENYTGPRTLDGRPVDVGSSSQSRAQQPKRQEKKRGVATLSSLGSGRHAHGSDEEDDEDEEGAKGRGDLFAGGEKSGLALRDPTRGGERGEGSRGLINDILAKAREQTRRGADEATEERPTRHWGAGQTLGGDGVESRRIADPHAGHEHAPPAGEPQERTIHIWHDGFSFDDGPLYRFDDPENQETLQLIRSGRAPLHLMNVRFDQPVNAHISQHDEPWRQLPRIYRPFGGEGRRLGSPVPGDGNVRPAPATSQPAAARATASSSSSATPNTGVDSSQPTLALRVQLPDGTRLPARFNTTQTVGDLYDFVLRAHPATQSRGFVVATTFPNKDHTDRALVLGEMPEFKKGGTAFVKWT